MNNDIEWDNTSQSYDPQTILNITEKTILDQTEYKYWYATVYGQGCALYGLQQHTMTNKYYYERFNTKVDIGLAIGMKRKHHVLM